jgi:hypothetical protein
MADHDEALSYKPEMYEILLDHDTVLAFQGGEVKWIADKEWRASGIDPSLFPRSTSSGEQAIPLKRILLDDNPDHHAIAAKYYALAHRKGYVRGPPECLLTFQIRHEDVVTYGFKGGINIINKNETLELTKLVNAENYPGFWKSATRHPIEQQTGDFLLAYGQSLIKRKRSATSPPTSPPPEEARTSYHVTPNGHRVCPEPPLPMDAAAY